MNVVNVTNMVNGVICANKSGQCIARKGIKRIDHICHIDHIKPIGHIF